MTEPTNPIADDVSDSRPLVKAGMTLRRKLVLLAVPTILAVISVPVGIAHAHGTVQGHAAAAAGAQATRSVAVKHVRSVAPKATVKAAAAVEPAETPEATTDPAETGTDTGHTDEVPGSTTESNVDHQFDGQE
jgi:Tfp pilus assembly protein FimT